MNPINIIIKNFGYQSEEGVTKIATSAIFQTGFSPPFWQANRTIAGLDVSIFNEPSSRKIWQFEIFNEKENFNKIKIPNKIPSALNTL